MKSSNCKGHPVASVLFLLACLAFLVLTTTDLAENLRRLDLDAGDVLSVIALVLVLLGWWATHRNTLLAQQEGLRNEVRVKAHDEFVSLCDSAQATISTAVSTWMLFPPFDLELRRQWGRPRAGEGQELAQKLSKVLSELLRSVNVALMYVENHRFLLGPLENMRLRIHAELDRLRHQGYTAVNDLAVDLIGDRYQADPEFRNKADGLLEGVLETAVDIGVYVQDLQREAENLLLGDLFEYRAPRRRPRDPAHEVLRPGPVEPEWERYRRYVVAAGQPDPGPYLGDFE